MSEIGKNSLEHIGLVADYVLSRTDSDLDERSALLDIKQIIGNLSNPNPDVSYKIQIICKDGLNVRATPGGEKIGTVRWNEIYTAIPPENVAIFGGVAYTWVFIKEKNGWIVSGDGFTRRIE